VRLPIPLLRQCYRIAYRALRVWWFVARPTVRGVKCAIVDGDRILLVRHTYGSRVWDLPGGAIKRGEAPVEAAGREVGEELGLEIDDWRPLRTIVGRAGHRRDRLHCFQAEVRSPHLTVDAGEIAAAEWFSRSALPSELGRYVRGVVAALEA
jgi:ADP-ribose pyrophosphatase YjhB (NUDIX family)